MASEPWVGVDLVAGFRNAGKTTLISALEETFWRNENTVFLQNEQGAASLTEISRYEGHAVVQLLGGCLCCLAAVQLEQALMQAVDAFRPSRIVLELAETAGVEEVRGLFARLGGAFRVEHILYVLNARDFPAKWELSQRFLERQFRACPAVMLNRTEHGGPASGEAITAVIQDINPQCAVFEGLDDLPAYYRKSRVFRQISFRTKDPGKGRYFRRPGIEEDRMTGQ